MWVSGLHVAAHSSADISEPCFGDRSAAPVPAPVAAPPAVPFRCAAPVRPPPVTGWFGELFDPVGKPPPGWRLRGVGSPIVGEVAPGRGVSCWLEPGVVIPGPGSVCGDAPPGWVVDGPTTGPDRVPGPLPAAPLLPEEAPPPDVWAFAAPGAQASRAPRATKASRPEHDLEEHDLDMKDLPLLINRQTPRGFHARDMCPTGAPLVAT